MSADYKQTELVMGNGVLSIGEDGANGGFACIRYYTTFQLNSIPFCKMVIVPEEGQDYTDLYSALNEYTPGDSVTLTFPMSGKFANNPSHALPDDDSMRGKNVVVFSGKFLGWAPVLQGKLLEVSVWAQHNLALLDWSSSVVDEIHGRSLGDPDVPMTVSSGESIVPYMPEPYKDEVVKDLWTKLIKKELLAITDYTRFGGGNQTASDVLNEDDLSSDELPLSMQTENAKRVIIDVRKLIYSPHAGNTLWDKLIQLADRYMFAVSPRINGFSIVPHIASLNTEVPVLQFQQFITENNFMAYVGRYFDAVNIVEGLASFSNPFDVVGRKPQPSQLRTQSPFGSEDYATGIFTAPAWTQIGNDVSFLTKKTTGIDGSIRAVGYSLEPGAADTDSNTPNKQYNDGGDDSARWASAMLNDQLFKQRTAYLKSSLRFDLAPGNLIAVENPRGDTGVAGYYGTVHTVCNAVSAGKGYSGTWVILSNVRTPAEQDDGDVFEHPLYGNKWVSAPLTDKLPEHVPGFVGE